MTEKKDGGHPFKLEFSEEANWSDFAIEIELNTPPINKDKKKLEDLLIAWVEKGMDEGYGGGLMHSWDKAENQWGINNRSFRFWVDAGSSDPEKSIDELISNLSGFNGIKKVKLG